EGPYLLRAEPEGRAAFAAQVSRLEAAGFVVKRAPFLTDFDELERKHRRMMAAEAVTEHEGWYAQYADRYSDHMHGIMQMGRSVDHAELTQSRQERLVLRKQVAAELARLGADLWISPPATGAAPEGIAATGNPIMNLPWTNAGVPALTIPAGRAANGLPLGLQIAAPFGQDERLLAWARQMEKEMMG
ncbi:MAG: amidase, partial [Caldilineaceae bacterium]|nr:amidase [Caldilineaceae bacterium]